MSSRTRPARPSTRGRRLRQRDDEDDIPPVYREMLAEAEARQTESSDGDRPRKRLKPAGYRDTATQGGVPGGATQDEAEPGETAAKTPQVVYNSPSESDESDMEWEEVDIQQPTHPGPSSSVSVADDTPLQITLGRQESQKRRAMRRKPVTAAERRLRLEVHKMHLLCLLCHVQRRNLWCNDEEVQGFVKKMLPKQIVAQLNPPEDKPQHTRSAMFLDGLNKAGDMFSRRFRQTRPGLRRAHWAHDADSLRQKTEAIMSDAEVFLSREDFRNQAKTMQGSRDFGAQLFCALLRSVAVDARLVCSLQPLPFSGTVRDIPAKPERQTIVISSDDHDSLTDAQTRSDASPKATPIRRLGRPSFKPASVKSTPAKPPLRESSYPVFWVEAFNEAFQKWIPIDPMVTRTLAKPHKLEPPAADPYNLLSYVVAFEEDASARDVTRRYTKAFNAKVGKSRVESTKGGEAWLARVLQFFEKPFLEDRDELEIAELTSKTATEPMPRNVQDFKDHPIYALERHLRRNEVIFPKTVIGHVGTGKSGATEPIYRRSAVHTLRSANKWYRLGRDIKVGEQPLKRVRARNRMVNMDDEDADMDQETALYAFFQTEPYTPPPVVQGRVPKNAYGNLDVYVPSMVPPGGVHIRNLEAARAARILGIDYADAVTGFNFKGRHGTAVFEGVVVATEYREAVEEVLHCLEQEKLQNELDQRSAEVLRTWKHFLLKLRIAERVKGYAVEGEADDEASVANEDADGKEDMGGGFLPESDGEMNSPQPTATNTEPDNLDDGTQALAEDGMSGGGFIAEDAEDNAPVTERHDSPRAARSKYSLVVVPNTALDSSDIQRPGGRSEHQKQAHSQPGTSIEAPISVGSSASTPAQLPITIDSSVHDSGSASVEILSRAPSQAQSRAPSPVAVSDSEDKGSLLSEDPEDQDAVPEWLMSD
ncbi:hypothetical protein BJX61DRAFT_552826 [Aspergillus egyptiacus]|nr:hypothetical protein BJX61DRAFT_552826 [Aspergillus egyptiacus]